MLFSLLKHYLDTDTALKVSQSVYCFTTSISHGVENYFPRLGGTGISDAILLLETVVRFNCCTRFCFHLIYCFGCEEKHYWTIIIIGKIVFSCAIFAVFQKTIKNLKCLEI